MREEGEGGGRMRKRGRSELMGTRVEGGGCGNRVKMKVWKGERKGFGGERGRGLK